MRRCRRRTCRRWWRCVASAARPAMAPRRCARDRRRARRRRGKPAAATPGAVCALVLHRRRTRQGPASAPVRGSGVSEGRELGQVSQQNAVPAGSLDGQWDDLADQVAGAAAPGIAELIERGKGRRARRLRRGGFTAPWLVCYSPGSLAHAAFPGDIPHENSRVQQQSAARRGHFRLSQLAASPTRACGASPTARSTSRSTRTSGG